MSVLEWILILEGVALATAAVMGLISLFIAKQNPDDPMYFFWRTFWREFLWPPEFEAIDSPRMAGRPARAAPSPRAPRSKVEEPSEEDEMYGRIPKAADGRVAKADLTVLVEANAPGDEVLGRDGDGIKIRVTGEAGESRSNKSLIEMVADAVGVKPYQVTLTKGHYQTRKVVQIQGLSREDLQEKLASLPDAE